LLRWLIVDVMATALASDLGGGGNQEQILPRSNV
jgi:hypothetical protein